MNTMKMGETCRYRRLRLAKHRGRDLPGGTTQNQYLGTSILTVVATTERFEYP
jgi:hypothetical protein